MTQQLPVISTAGTPYQIGFSHGSQAKEYVLNSIATYQNMFSVYAGLTWTEAKNRSRSYIDHITAYDQELLAEIEGLADGAGVDVEDILALNARSEVVLMQAPQLTDGCTCIALTPEFTKTGNTLLAQNWDWKSTQINSCIVLKIKQQHKPEITMVTEAGIIGKIGFNSTGLGVCLNALGTPGQPNGVPLHLILRGILNSETISDAVAAITKTKNACPANYLLAHKAGEALNIEVTPDDFDVFYPEQGYLVHTNHFISTRLKVNDTLRRMAPDTFMRLGRTNKLLRQNAGQLSVDDIKNILADHIEYPDSICRHDDLRDPIGVRMATVFSIIMDLSAMKMWLTKGAPCSTNYYQLE